MADPAWPAAVAELANATFPGAVLTGQSELDLRSRDESHVPPCRPAAVFLPGSPEMAAEMVRFCAEHDLRIVPFGAGSGQEGAATPEPGCVSIDMRGVDRILEISPDDMDCLVEAGVTRLQLERALRGTGLFFPVDPGADATIGGMCATRASGTLTPLYGSMRDNVVSLDIVTAEGETFTTGARVHKSSTGYDLTRLFLGSEGTLGLIVRARLRLHAQPEARIALRAVFENIGSATTAVISVLQSGLPVARAELLDGLMMKGVNLHAGTNAPELPTLFLEFHGNPRWIEDAAALAIELLGDAGARSSEVARKTEEQSAIWRARHTVADAERRLRAGATTIVTDVCVSHSKLSGILLDAFGELEARRLTAPLSAHMGAGNFHFALLVDPDDPTEASRAEAFKTWLAERALAVGGSVSGEHGIGIGKRGLMAQEHGPALELMRRIKTALDPSGLFNPGKLLP